MNCLRHTSQLSIANGRQGDPTSLNQVMFQKDISFPPLSDFLKNTEI